MTDAAEFAGILERALLRRLLEPAHVVTCPVPANTTQADLDEARGITRQRLSRPVKPTCPAAQRCDSIRE